MDLWLAAYAYWALMILGLSSLTVLTLFKVDFELGLVPMILVEACLAMYLSLKILTVIHLQHPHLFASAAAVDKYVTSTRQGAACTALAMTILLILLTIDGLGLLMGTFMWLADPPVTPNWHWVLFFVFWIGYLSFFVHLLFVWVASIRLAFFGPRGAIALV